MTLQSTEERRVIKETPPSSIMCQKVKRSRDARHLWPCRRNWLSGCFSTGGSRGRHDVWAVLCVTKRTRKSLPCTDHLGEVQYCGRFVHRRQRSFPFSLRAFASPPPGRRGGGPLCASSTGLLLTPAFVIPEERKEFVTMGTDKFNFIALFSFFLFSRSGYHILDCFPLSP